METRENTTTEIVPVPSTALVPYDREADEIVFTPPPSIVALLEDEESDSCGNCCDSNCGCF